MELTADGAAALAAELFDIKVPEVLAGLGPDDEVPGAEEIARVRAEIVDSAREIGALCDGRTEAEIEQRARAAEREARRCEADAAMWERVLEQLRARVAEMQPGAEGEAAARPLPTSETYPSFLTEAETEYLLRAATAPAVGGGGAAGETLAMQMHQVAEMLREMERFQRAADQQNQQQLRAEYRAREAPMRDVGDARALLRAVARPP